MMWGYGINMGWLWPLALLICGGLVLLLLVAWAVVSAIKLNEVRHSGSGTVAASTPRQILDRRYAEGELTTDEYTERLKVLGGAG